MDYAIVLWFLHLPINPVFTLELYLYWWELYIESVPCWFNLKFTYPYIWQGNSIIVGYDINSQAK